MFYTCIVHLITKSELARTYIINIQWLDYLVLFLMVKMWNDIIAHCCSCWFGLRLFPWFIWSASSEISWCVLIMINDSRFLGKLTINQAVPPHLSWKWDLLTKSSIKLNSPSLYGRLITSICIYTILKNVSAIVNFGHLQTGSIGRKLSKYQTKMYILWRKLIP